MLRFEHVNTLNPFDWFLILGIITMNVIYSILQHEIDALGSIAAITGVVCVVMVFPGPRFFGRCSLAVGGSFRTHVPFSKIFACRNLLLR